MLRDIERELAFSDPEGAIRLSVLEKLEQILSELGRDGEAREIARKRDALGAE